MADLFFVYILASRRNGTLYVGVTNDLARRVWEHKQKAVPGFTRTYGVDRLVYFEQHESILQARERARAQTVAPHLEDRADRESRLARSCPGPATLI